MKSSACSTSYACHTPASNVLRSPSPSHASRTARAQRASCSSTTAAVAGWPTGSPPCSPQRIRYSPAQCIDTSAPASGSRS